MRVAIVDYGSGNLRSAVKAFQRAAFDHSIRADIVLTSQADEIKAADRIVLPGVGTFADCRQGLENNSGLMQALDAAVSCGGRPFFGICVGMQLMATFGYEKTETPGLNWIGGEVRELTLDKAALKLPQIGWNTITLNRNHDLFAGIATGDEGWHAYFVHSYGFYPYRNKDRLATTEYGGTVTAAMLRDNMFGTQFHPEKSQRLGLKLIANFLEWKP